MKHLKISKNFETVSLITNTKELMILAENKKGVYVRNWKRISPASIITRMQLYQVMIWIEQEIFWRIKRIDDE